MKIDPLMLLNRANTTISFSTGTFQASFWTTAFLAAVVGWTLVVVVRTLIRAYGTPLSNVPGPWIAKFTRLWLLRAIASRSWQNINVDLHQKYGPIVRISPNEYSIDDPEAAKIIYRTRNELVKAKRYLAWGLPGVEQTVFSQRDIERHNFRRAEANALYSNNFLYSLESPLNTVLETLLGKFSQHAKTGEVIDLFDWLHFFAFDAIGVVTFGKSFGFLQRGQDIRDIMKTIHNYSRYGAVMGVYAEWHPMVFKLMTTLASGKDVGMAYLIKFTNQTIAEWRETAPNCDEKKTSSMLSELLSRHQSEPEKFSLRDVHFHILPNVVAGAETTGITLSAAAYFLWKNPNTLMNLREELDARNLNRKLGNILTMKDLASCRYLQAVIKETLRLHPGNGLGFTRLVPEGGLILAGRHFPEGTEVNINAYVAHLNQTVFGKDPESFRPERWLQDEVIIQQMDNYLLTFGKGTRTCLGKNISLMEINKLVAELALQFDFEFEDPDREWTVYNDWFVSTKDIKVKVKERHCTK